jgi:hypothetical protein
MLPDESTKVNYHTAIRLNSRGKIDAFTRLFTGRVLFGVKPAGYKAKHTAEQQQQAESGLKVESRRKVGSTPSRKKLRQ